MDASVLTEMATMTEPESLGPMDPGSSVSLEGIVWHETDNGESLKGANPLSSPPFSLKRSHLPQPCVPP